MSDCRSCLCQLLDMKKKCIYIYELDADDQGGQRWCSCALFVCGFKAVLKATYEYRQGTYLWPWYWGQVTLALAWLKGPFTSTKLSRPKPPNWTLANYICNLCASPFINCPFINHPFLNHALLTDSSVLFLRYCYIFAQARRKFGV
jgi:hypothetical protein